MLDLLQLQDIIQKAIKAKIFNMPIVEGWTCILKFVNTNSASINKENDAIQFIAIITDKDNTEYSVKAYLYPFAIEDSLKIDFSTLSVSQSKDEHIDTDAMLYTPSSLEYGEVQAKLNHSVKVLTSILDRLALEDMLLSKASIDALNKMDEYIKRSVKACKEFSDAN